MQSSPAPAAASAAAPGAMLFKIEKKDLLRYLGNRVRLELDDRSVLTGKLVSVSASGNIILTDPERERTRKRQRGEDAGAPSRVSRECYASVIFVKDSSITAVLYTSGVTTDKNVVNRIGGREEQVSRSIEAANASPAVGM